MHFLHYEDINMRVKATVNRKSNLNKRHLPVKRKADLFYLESGTEDELLN